MAKQGNIKFGVQFQVDKAGLKSIEAQLKDISKMTVKDVINASSITDATQKLNAAKTAATQMQQALEAGFNVKLNTVNLEKFQQSLKESGTSLSKLQADLSHIEGGTTAFRDMAAQLLTTNRHLKESSQLLTKMGETLSNTIRWSVASTAINSVTGSIQKAWSFTKQLDTSLNDIMIVTGKSADEMDRFAVKANKAAKELGASTKAYSDAALIYYQQGLNDTQAQARANVTVKAANVTGQDARAVSEQLTAVWNGYKVSAQEAELYVDKLAAVAASTAADLEELSTGMSRVASAANIMGVDIDQLNAQLATIVSVTREAPESIGTALKTVYARMSDLEAGLDAETTLGEYTQQMASFGIQALDANGKLRDMGDVVEEIGNRWNTLSRNQQVALAQTIAGTRQYSRMMSLFDNWDMYEEALNTSKGSAGTLQKQQDTYLESTEAHLEKLGATAEDLYASLFDTEDVNSLIDMLAKLVDGVDNFVEAIGGGAGVLRNFGSIAFNVFNKQIANSAARAVTNVQGFFDNQAQEKAQQQLLRDLGMSNMSINDEGVREILDLKKKIDSVNDLLTEDERKQGDEYIRQIASLRKQQDELRTRKKIIEETVKIATGEELTDEDWSNPVKVGVADRELKYSSQGFQALEAIMGDIIKESGAVGQAASKYGAAAKTSAAYKGHQTRIKKQIEQAKIDGMPERSDELFDHPDYEFQGQDAAALSQKQQEAEERYAAALARRATAYDELKIRLEAMAGKTSDLLSVEEQHALASMKLTKEEQEQAAAYSKTVEAYHKGDAAFQQNEQNIKEYQEAWKGLLAIISSSRQKMDDARKGIKTLNQEIEQNQTELDNAAQSVEYFTRTWDTKKLVSNITSVSGGITNIVSGIQTLMGLGSIWDNDDLTTGEKFAQTLMNIGMTIPMLIQGFSALNPLISLFTAKKKAQAAVDAASLIVQKATIANDAIQHIQAGQKLTDIQREALLNYALSLSESDVTRNKILTALASESKKGALDAETASLLKNTTANGVNAASEGLDAASKTANGTVGGFKAIGGGLKKVGKGAVKGLGAIGNAGGGSLGAVGGAVAGGVALLAVVAAVAAVTAGIKYAIEWANKERDAMFQAEEQAAKHAETVAELEGQYENLIQSTDKYKELQDDLSELTEGTDEYNKALKENNKQVMDLIKKYPQLAAQVKNTNGVLSFEGDALEQVQDQQENKLETEQALAYSAEAASLEAKNTYLKSEGVSNALWDGEDTTKTVLAGVGTGAAGAAAAAGAATAVLHFIPAIGSIASGIITAAAGVIGAVAGIFGGISEAEHQQEESNRVMDAFTRAYEKDDTIMRDAEALKQALRAEGILDEDVLNEYAEKLMANTEEMEKLGAEVAANTRAAQLQRDQAASSYLDSLDNAKYASSEYKEQVTRLVANEKLVYENRYKEHYEDLDDDEVHEEYAKMMGYTYVDDGDGEGVFKKRNEDGTTEEVKVDDEYMRATLSDKAAFNEAGKRVEEFVDQMESFTDILDDAKDGIASNAEKALANLSVGLDVEFSNLTLEEINKFAEYAQTNMQDKFTANIQRQNEAAAEAIKNASQYLTEVEKESWNQFFDATKGNLAKLTEAEAKYLADLYDKGIATSEAKFNKFFEEVAASGENVGEVAALLDNIDWGANNAEEQFIKLMKDHNIVVNTASTATKEFIDELRWLASVQETSLEALSAKAKTLEEVISAASEKGAEITSEQYALLSSELQTYFTRALDGTYKLTRSAKEFADMAQRAYQESIKNSLAQQIEQRKETQTKLNAAKNKDNFKTKTTTNSTEVANNEAAKRTFGANRPGGAGYVLTNEEAELALNSGSESGLEFDIGNNQAAAQGLLFDWLMETEEGRKAGKTLAEGYKLNSSLSYEDQIRSLTQEQWDDIVEFSGGENFTIDFQGELGKEIGYSKGMMAQQILQARNASGKYSTETVTTTSYDQTDIKDWISELESFGLLSTADADRFRDNVNQNAFMTVGEGDIVSKIKAAMTTVDDTTGIKNLAASWLSSAQSKDELNAIINELIKDDGLYNVDDILSSSEWQDMIDNAKNLVKETEKQNTLKSYEEQVAALQEINGEYEHMNSLLEHQRTLIELIGKDSYSKMSDFYTKSLQVLDNQLTLSANTVAYWKAEMDRALAEGQTALYEEAKAQWEEATNTHYENMSQKIELLKEQYINSINKVFDEQEKLWSSGKSLNYINNQWDLMEQRAEQFLDPVNEAFEKQKIENKFNTAINDAASINAQKRLKDLMEDELAVLEDKDKLSEYDLKRAEARLEVEKAQIALEEARANKSKMRLMRGADGTYSYQYVADVDNITKAQEALADAQQKLYNLDVDEYKDNLNTLLELYQDYKEKMIEINQITSEDERNAQLQLLKEEYLGEDGLLTSLLGNNDDIKQNLSSSFGDAMALLGEDFGTLGDAVDATTSSLAQFVENMNFDNLENQILDLETPWAQIAATTEDWNEALTESYAIIQNIATAMETVFKTLGVSDPELFAETVATLLTGSSGKTQVNTGSGESQNVSLGDMIDVIDQANTIDVNEQAGNMGGRTYKIKNLEAFKEYLITTGLAIRRESGDLTASSNKKLSAWFAENGGSSQDTTFKEFIRHITDDDQIWRDNYLILVQLLNDISKAGGIEKLDTGGYTGEWGTSGRLALLHEKELVLNQTDTSNILQAVNTMRKLSNALNSSMYDNALARLTALCHQEISGNSNDMNIEQNVHITAEFPNATDRSEIEAAFDELINLATQQVFENKRS